MDRAIGYRVMYLHNAGTAKSLFAGQASVEYRPGAWTSAPAWMAKAGYHITYFPSAYYANAWRESIPPAIGELDRPAVWVGLVENLVDGTPPPKLTSAGISFIRDEAKRRSKGSLLACAANYYSIYDWASCTLMCRRFMPTRRWDETPHVVRAWCDGCREDVKASASSGTCARCGCIVMVGITQAAKLAFDFGLTATPVSERRVRDWLKRDDAPTVHRGPGRGRDGRILVKLSEWLRWCPPFRGGQR